MTTIDVAPHAYPGRRHRGGSSVHRHVPHEGQVLRVVALGRVSTEEQVEGYSLDAQERAWVDECARRGWDLTKRLIEPGNSAWTDDLRRRPVLRQAIEMLERGEADVLMVHKLDRFARNTKLTMELLARIEKARCGFLSISEQMDFSTPMGRLAVTMLAGMAEYFSNNLSTEARKGKAERVRQGKSNAAWRPLGYHRDWTVCPAAARVMRRIFAEYADGNVSIRELVTELNARRVLGRRWAMTSLNKMLKNPTYVGEVVDGTTGTRYPGQHPAIISKETWDAVQKALVLHASAPRTHSPATRDYALAGILRCVGCGYPMRAETALQQGPKGTREYPRYGEESVRSRGIPCPKPQSVVAAHQPEGQVRALLASIPVNTNIQAAFEQAWLALQADGSRERVADQRKVLEDRRRRLNKMYELGELDDADYAAKVTDVRRAIEALPNDADEQAWREKAAAIPPLLTSLVDGWESLPARARRLLLGGLLSSVDFDTESRTVVRLHSLPGLEPLFRLSPALREDPPGAFVPHPPLPAVKRKHRTRSELHQS